MWTQKLHVNIVYGHGVLDKHCNTDVYFFYFFFRGLPKKYLTLNEDKQEQNKRNLVYLKMICVLFIILVNVLLEQGQGIANEQVCVMAS